MTKNTSADVEIMLPGYNPQIIALGVGSCEYQIASFTKKIDHIKKHLVTAKKDFVCKHSLIKLVSKRSKLLKYIKVQDDNRYKELLSYLDIRK